VDVSQPVFYSCGHQGLQLRKVCSRLAADSRQVGRRETCIMLLDGKPRLAGVRQSGRLRAHLCHAVQQRTIDLLVLLHALLVRLGLSCCNMLVPFCPSHIGASSILHQCKCITLHGRERSLKGRGGAHCESVKEAQRCDVLVDHSVLRAAHEWCWTARVLNRPCSMSASSRSAASRSWGSSPSGSTYAPLRCALLAAVAYATDETALVRVSWWRCRD
jgi:hypothetical protein